MRRFPVAIFSLVSSLVLIIGFVFPRAGDLDGLRKKIKEREKDIQFKEQYFADLRDLRESLAVYQPQMEKIDSAVPEKTQLPALYSFLQKASSDSGLILAAVSPVAAAPSKIEGLQELSLSFTASGSYSSLKSFLSALENSARFFEITNISFSQPKPKEKTFSFNIAVKAYGQQ